MSWQKRPPVYNKENWASLPIVSSVNVSTVPATALLSLGVRQKKHCAIKPQLVSGGHQPGRCAVEKKFTKGHGIILSNSGAGGFEVVAFTCTLARQMSKAFLQAYFHFHNALWGLPEFNKGRVVKECTVTNKVAELHIVKLFWAWQPSLRVLLPQWSHAEKLWHSSEQKPSFVELHHAYISLPEYGYKVNSEQYAIFR